MTDESLSEEHVDFARGVTPELREQIRAAHRAERTVERQAALAPWEHTRGSTNRYYWTKRYFEVDGVLHQLHPDGSSGPVTRTTALDILNGQAAQIESLGFRDGVLHSMLGMAAAVESCVDLLRERGFDGRMSVKNEDSPLITEWIDARLRSGLEALEAESAALRKRYYELRG